MKGITGTSFSGKKFLLLSFFFFMFSFASFATHNRAGEIIYTHISGFTYQITIITYTKESAVAADRDSLPIDWGDGTFSNPDIDTLKRTVEISLGNDIKYNEYTGSHTYPGLGTYVLSMTDPNRISDILNINQGNSVNEPFYIEDTLKILNPNFYGYDNSPILLNPPIDFGNQGQVFVHNPNAYDPDGDSLSFRFIIPRKASGINVANYVDPNLVPGTPAGNTFTIDENTGEVTWDSPYFCGIYNFAILVSEFRSGVCIGTMVRDMEVIVNCVNDDPPVIDAVHDTCVVAGDTLVLHVHATDPNPGQTVSFTSNGGPYVVTSSPATFTGNTGIDSASGIFIWNTNCDHIREPFYQVIFKAEDSYPVPLVDIENWLITVVGPPVQNVLADPVGNDINVTWQNPYSCSGALRFIGFSVWRREGSNPFAIDTCEVGLNGRGYTKIAEHLLNYSYLDLNVDRGKEYCYRILAEFADTALSQNIPIYYNNVYSIPSNEACTQLLKEVPVITNVSVTSTDVATGTMFIGWSKPNAVDLDTIQNPGPYKYVLWRVQDFTSTGMQRIDSIEAPTFALLIDTFYNDVGLNTQDHPYTYKIGFYSNNNFMGETETASSVYLSTIGADNMVNLSWSEFVPWTNDSFVVYRKNAVAVFDSIGITTSHAYADTGLTNGIQQCYLVKSVGAYSAPGFVDPIINYSEEKCDIPIDTIGPCPPTLTVTDQCNDADFTQPGFVNLLNWNAPDISCANDVTGYHIFYATSQDAPLVLIDSVSSITFSFLHQLQSSVAGCYAVAAIDSYYNEGPKSNVVCVDNCPAYVLPNVFTPNGDEKNDIYHPFLPYRFVDKVDMKIFDQWGRMVYATSDPFIGWDGKDMNTHADLPESTYYYMCLVYSGGVLALPQLSGYIHIFR